MIYQILMIIAIVMVIKSLKKKRHGRKRGRHSKHLIKNDLASLRSRFQENIQYFNPQHERERLTRAFHQLMNSSGRTVDSYKKLSEIVKSIVLSREKDIARIKDLSRLKQRYDRSKDTFTDQLRADIDVHMDRADQMLTNEYFASGIDELKLIVRYIPWLIKKGEEGRDNSVHWKVESMDKKESIRKQVMDERGMWKVLGFEKSTV